MNPLRTQNKANTTYSQEKNALPNWSQCTCEPEQVDWLILHFNHWFSHQNVILVRGEHEPEYFPATQHTPARIQFAHGFFNSALHEISHWCIAGPHRRTLPDLGYWYAPDGRSEEQQALFEKVEIKPQALEWLFAKSCQRPFRVSLDNLTGHAGNGKNFKDNVYTQVQQFFAMPNNIPSDGLAFANKLCQKIRHGQHLDIHEFNRKELD